MKCSGNIFLVGLPGAGKTTVGRLLAQRLQKQFVDCDHELVKRTGVTISTIFEIEGEAGFRLREARLLEELTRFSEVILATGGGAVLRPDNRSLLASRGYVIYLRAVPAELWLRTRHDKSRPLLQGGNAEAKLVSLHAERDPLYREIADSVVNTGTQSVKSLVRQIENRLRMQVPVENG
jgi:shikimate kinase